MERTLYSKTAVEFPACRVKFPDGMHPHYTDKPAATRMKAHIKSRAGAGVFRIARILTQLTREFG